MCAYRYLPLPARVYLFLKFTFPQPGNGFVPRHLFEMPTHNGYEGPEYQVLPNPVKVCSRLREACLPVRNGSPR